MGDFTLPLKDFLECFPSPQHGRLVEGYRPDFGLDEAFNLPRGTLVKFHRTVNPTVPLSFFDSMGGGRISVNLPVEFPEKFKLLPYDPVTDDRSPDHIYRTVEDLVKAFPIFVQANASYFDRIEDQGMMFDCGDRLKLIRLVFKHGWKMLECRLLSGPRLILLPMDCVGNFIVVPDENEYLLADILSMLPRRRLLRLIDAYNSTIPGLTRGFSGDLYLELPDAFVEASPIEDDSGLIIGLPLNTKINIIPEETSYDRGQYLNTFATNNRNLFPVVARITGWNEETTILENHFIKPGVELVIHGWTRQSKILAKSAGTFYAIPLTYQGKFQIRPQKFNGVIDLERSHPAYKVRVVEVNDTFSQLVVGDVLRIKREESIKRSKDGEIRYLRCDRYDSAGKNKIKEVKVPLNANIKLEELLEDAKADRYTTRELVTFVNDQEVIVDLVEPGSDQKLPEKDLPMNHPIVLCDYIVESAVYVSMEMPDAPAFHIPLRTLLYVKFVCQLEKFASPLLTKQNPKLSTLDRCVEILPPDAFVALRPMKLQQAADEGTTNVMSSTLPASQALAWNPSPHSQWANSTTTTTHTEVTESQKSRKPTSVTESDGTTGKSKGFSLKIKDRFRKHKSTENVHKVGQQEFASLSLAPETPPEPDVILTQDNYTYTSNQNEPERVTMTETTTTTTSEVTEPASLGVITKSEETRFESRAPLLTNGHVKEKTIETTRQRAGSVSTPSSSSQPSPGGRESPISTSIIHQTASVNDTSRGTRTTSEVGHPAAITQYSMMAPQVPVMRSVSPQPALYSMPPVAQPLQQSEFVGDSVSQVFQPPGGYMLMQVPQPAMPPPATIPPGYMLMPMMPQQQYQMAPQQQQYQMAPQQYQMAQYPIMAGAPRGPANDDDSDEAESTFTPSKTSQFKVAIPKDGNLYNFNSRKMAEFLRQLRLDDNVIQNCLKHKVDGKKLSKMEESEMESLGLLHPLVIHFRKLTHKRKSHH